MTLERKAGQYALYPGGGIHQSFGYTSKGEMESAITASLETPATALRGRSVALSYDGQGNRKWLKVDGQFSHAYTANRANEYSAVSYSGDAGWVMGVAEDPGQVVVGGELAERTGGYFYRGYAAGASPSWTTEWVLAAAAPSMGGTASIYKEGEKDVYLPPSSVDLSTTGYDAAGNLLADGWWTYVYDGENRLIRMTSVADYPGEAYQLRLEFAYDYLGRRTRKTVETGSGSTWTPLSDTAFAYWEWHLLAEIDLVSDSLLRHYAWGLDKEGVRPGAGGVGGLLMVSDPAASKDFFALNDYLGNVIGLVDASDGSSAAEYEYDPFGRSLRTTGTYADQNPIRFSSQYTDHETGLVYFGFRYYHPQ